VTEPELPPSIRLRSRLAQTLGKAVLFLARFRTQSIPVHDPKLVCVCAPHTSNWDLPIFLAAAWALGLRVSWLGKHTIFRFPFGPLLRAMGGIPVDRTRRTGLVQQVAEEFSSRDGLLLGLAAEGTRKYTASWKSGFYFMALEAKVPLGLAYLDFATRTVGFRAFMSPSGDVAADMERIRAVYAGIRGKHPEQESAIRLEEEGREPAAPAGR
jgi:1-acyl-sn-glycerol-3-phosphate acyltransferase